MMHTPKNKKSFFTPRQYYLSMCKALIYVGDMIMKHMHKYFHIIYLLVPEFENQNFKTSKSKIGNCHLVIELIYTA